MSERSDRIAQSVADAFGAGASSIARATWRVVCRLLEAYFADRWLEIYVNPTVAPGIWQSGGDPLERRPWPPNTMAFQYDAQVTNVLVGIWVNVDGTATGWRRVWPGDTAALPFSDDLPTIVDALSAASAGVKDEIPRVDHKHALKVYGGTMRPPGQGSPGDADDDTVSKGTHDHPDPPPPDPATKGARLFTAIIDGAQSLQVKAILAPLQRWDDVDAVGFDYYGGFENISNGWYQTAPDTWETTVNRAMLAGELGGVEPFVGLRFAYLTNSSGSVTPTAKAAYGFYVVTRLGGPSEKAQFVRATDADASGDFLTDKIVNCTGGVNWGGHTFLYSGADNPTLGTSQLSFEDHGTDSIYAAKMKFGFGDGPGPLRPTSGGICQWVAAVDEGFREYPYRYLGADGKPTGAPQAGERFYVGADYEEGDGYIDESEYFGAYEWVVYWNGEGGSYIKVLRRVAEMGANTADGLTNLVIGVSGVGMLHQGEFTQQTEEIEDIDETKTEWSAWSSTSPSPDTRNLLTAAQLGLASTETVTIRAIIPPGGGLLIPSGPPYTRVGTPNLSTLPGGTEVCQAGSVWISPQEGWDIDADPGRASVDFRLWRKPQEGDEVLLFNAQSGIPLTVNPQTVKWEKTITEQTIAPTDLVDLVIWIQSTYDREIEVCFVINSVKRDTWVQLADVTFPIGGTDDHQALRRRDQDVASSTPSVADPCHPACAIGAGRLHTPWPSTAATYDVSTGYITAPADTATARGANLAVVTLAGTVTGIESAGWLPGDELELLILGCTKANRHNIVNNASVTGTVRAIAICQRDLASDTRKPYIQVYGDLAVAHFRLSPDGTVWLLTGITQ